MPTTRPILPRLLGAVTVAALALTAAACGDDDDSSAFCDEMREVDAELQATDPTTDEGFQAALDRLREVEPPPEIEEAWATFLDAYQALADVDTSDPEAIDALDTEQLAGAEQAWNEIADHLEEECGLEV
ncbi:MAG TPA: hypothetical protein VKZ72_06705 [Acidimicrobiales bacterium]|jgi:hypothetical protein|nr:hypothetical protein [Acidimicrobiales bacterium]